MIAILQPTDIKRHKYSENNDPHWDSILEIEVHESLHLTCEIQATKDHHIERIIVKELL